MISKSQFLQMRTDILNKMPPDEFRAKWGPNAYDLFDEKLIANRAILQGRLKALNVQTKELKKQIALEEDLLLARQVFGRS